MAIKHRFLDLSENRAAVKLISQQILAEVEPDELEVTAQLIEPLIDMAARDEVVVYNPAHQAGGLGSDDLLTLVVVPFIGRVLENLSKLVGTRQVKEELDQLIQAEVEKAMDEMVRRTHSSQAKRKSKALQRAATIEVTLYIGQLNVAGGDLSASHITPQSGEDQVNVIRLTQSIDKGDVQTAGGDQVNIKRPSRVAAGDTVNERSSE